MKLHPELPFLSDIAIIFAVSAISLFLCHKLRIPSILGFLFAGIAAGPGGFGLIGSSGTVSALSELGVILLLFSIGVEFSFGNLLRLKTAILVGGGLQVVLTAAAVFGICTAAGMDWQTALIAGFLVALSSTAIVLKMMQDAGETGTPHGRTTLAFLIFQDVAVIPMMLVIPWLTSNGSGAETTDILLSVGKGLALIVVVILAAKYLVPNVLKLVVATRSKELFLLIIVLICFTTAWATAALGLSLALGAFVAGLVVSESEFSHHALGNVIPFRDLFLSFFFVSVGMLLDIHAVIEAPFTILAVAAIVIAVKTIIAGGAAFVIRQPARSAVTSGMMLAQIGEFSFILAGVALASGLFPQEYYQIFLSVAILTIALTPLLHRMAPLAANVLFSAISRHSAQENDSGSSPANDHLVIIGFGLNGQNIARAAKRFGIVYRILEMNNDTVRHYQKQGEPIIFGDATQEHILHHLGVSSARIAVVAISDAAATRRIVELVRESSPNIRIIARTRFISEVQPLTALGADEVIPEEFETALEVFARVLRHYHIAEHDIRASLNSMRTEHYQVFRSAGSGQETQLKPILERTTIDSIRVGEMHQCNGRTIAELNLRKRFKITVLGIQREGTLQVNPGADDTIQSGDVLVLMGEHPHIAAAADFLLTPASDV